MANPDHLALARQGRDAWNKWRRRNPGLPADFSGTDFTAPAFAAQSFAGLDLGPGVDFSGCVFGGVDHRGVAARQLSPYAAEVAPHLGGGAWFYGARFGDGARFTGATFQGAALFQNAVFGRGADFARAQFMDEANFVGARFGADARFAQASFAGLMQFERAHFAGAVSFEGAAAGVPGAATLPRLVFRMARFAGPARFARRRFLDRADFGQALFDVPPDFAETAGHERLDFADTTFRLREGWLPGWSTRGATLASIRTLAEAARAARAGSAARDLHILARKAQRGLAWKHAAQAPWTSPLRKLGLYGRAFVATVLLALYGLLADCGRSVVRPLIWLGLVNAGAYFALQALARPASTVVGRAARGTWSWIRSIFVSEPGVPGTVLSAEQQRALFEFWWSGTLPGAITRATYEKAAISLFGTESVPPLVHVLQGGQVLLNAGLLLLLALGLRNHFRAGT